MREMTLKAAQMIKIKAISAGILLAWSLPSQALTLGKFQVQSAIGEPLRAEVEIMQFSPDELRGLQAQLGSPASFRQAGMEYNAALNGMVAKIETRQDGRPVIVLSGRTPVQDSFIDLILEAQWSAGRAVKTYALLLNSASPASIGRQTNLPAPAALQQEPIQARTAAASVSLSEKPSSSTAEIRQAPASRFEPDGNIDALSSSASTKQHKKSPISRGDTITINPGDTLSNVMMGSVPANVSLDQMLLALVRANPNAFIEGNVNLVRAGSVLRVPTQSEAAQISRAQAHQTIAAQRRDFAAYARRVAESALLVGSSKSREMSGSVTTETQKSPPPSLQQDKLTLSKAQTSDANDEAKLASGREAKDAADQLAALNKNMQDLEALAKNPSNTSPSSVSPPELGTESPPMMTQLRQHWAWIVAALLALLALVFYSRKKDTQANAVFAPSYDDYPDQSTSPKTVIDTPPQMAGIDLNLDSHPPRPANEEDDQNKLALASQLLTSGDKELARTLIMSVVASTNNGELRSRAQQMLGQIA